MIHESSSKVEMERIPLFEPGLGEIYQIIATHEHIMCWRDILRQITKLLMPQKATSVPFL